MAVTDATAVAAELRIAGIDAARCSFPLRHPVRFGPATYASRDYALLRIRSDAGAVGFGAALTRGTPLLEALRPVAERLAGRDVGGAQALVRELRRENVPGHPALVRAHSLADLALWDLVARASEAPLAQLLGGAKRRSVGVLAVCGYLIDVRGEDAVVDELTRLADDGYRHLKLMLGTREPSWMHAFLSRCRAALPDEVLLSLDLHFSLATLEEAVALCAPLDELGLAFIEDPFPPLRWRDLRALSERIATPLGAGEDVTDPVTYADLLEGATVLRVDPATCGGLEDALVGFDMAAAANKPALPHGSLFVAAQLAAVRETIEWVEIAAPLDTGDRFAELCPDASLALANGELTIGEQPGADVPLEWTRVTELAAAGWSV